jgi:hypothetical protein
MEIPSASISENRMLAALPFYGFDVYLSTGVSLCCASFVESMGFDFTERVSAFSGSDVFSRPGTCSRK